MSYTFISLLPTLSYSILLPRFLFAASINKILSTELRVIRSIKVDKKACRESHLQGIITAGLLGKHAPAILTG